MAQRRIMNVAALVALVVGLIAGGVAAPRAAADGVLDRVIGNEYGATRAIDGAGNDATNGDSESCAVADGNRGNLMELHAYNKPGNNEWYFAFVVDSSQALDSITGDFFGKGAGMTVNYILGIDVGCDGGPAGDMNSGSWKRFFSWQGAKYNNANPGVDYFVPMFPTGADALNAAVWSMSGTTKTLLASNVPVTTRVVDYRRHVELRLDPVLSGMPPALVGNNQLCLALVTTENSDNVDGNGGRVLDDLGEAGSVTGCDLSYRLDGTGGNGPMPAKIATQPNCQASRRPMPGGAATRQCTSLPARTTVPALDSTRACTLSQLGVNIDGNIESSYVLLTEAGYAGPYQGGDAAHSDFGGESAAYSYWTGSAMATYAGNADVRDVHVQTDAHFLYLNVSGPGLTAFGGQDQMAGQPADEANLFLALDLGNIASTTDRGDHGGGPEAYIPPNAAAGADASNHPGSRLVNFRGWAPDYIIEMVWAGDDGTIGNAQLWSWNNGSATWNLTAPYQFTTVETTGSSPSGAVPFNTAYYAAPNQPPPAAALVFGRQPTSYEFAIPWVALGGKPPLATQIRLGAYTGRNPDGWDINDQAPGVGQGANGLGSHERIGDLPDENDNEADAGAAGNDKTPYVGRTHGQAGRAPGSDNTAGDSDTIEAYFVFTQDPAMYNCPSPLAVDLAAFTASTTADGVTLAWETVSETDNAGFNVHRTGSVGDRPEQEGWVKLNDALIPAAAPGSSEGHAYTWTDAAATAGAAAGATTGASYWYMLEDVALDGTATRHDPVAVTMAEPNAVGLAGYGATGYHSGWAGFGDLRIGGLAVLVLAALGGVTRRRRH